MSLLFDPRIFNFVIMSLYVLNGVNWLVRKEYGQASYWLGAFWITASVTFGMTH